MNDLEYIYKVQKDISLLSSVYSLLEWDMNTNLPSGGYKGRSEQMALLDNLIYEMIVSPRFFSSIKRLKERDLSSRDRVVVDELFKETSRTRAVTKSLSSKIESQRALCNSSWNLARESNDFSIFADDLQKMISLKTKYALSFNNKDIYDSFIEEYEPNMNTKKLDEIFSYLKKELIVLLNKIKSSPKYVTLSNAVMDLRITDENRIIKHYLESLGISSKRLSISTSVHPFTSKVSRNDVRITTDKKSGIVTFFSAVHEAGHALYDLGLPKDFNKTVIFEASSLGMHESQSTLWEQKIAKSKSFWKGYFTVFEKYMSEKYDREEFYNSINTVKPSLIRTDADEITYPLHIILRYEIERELFSGKLAVKDLSKRWKEKSIELLGIEPNDDNTGVLQDIHWADGDFGYFPTYVIGLIYSAQIYKKLNDVFPDFENMIQRQEFLPISDWLHENIHQYGKTLSSEKIMKKACGEGLNPKIFISYLNNKYSKIYDF